MMSHRSQIIILIWALAFMVIYGLTLWRLLHMFPPPSASWTADQVAAFYRENSLDIRLGAMVASWTSAFMIPFSAVVAVQMRRLETGLPVWTVLQFAGGITMSMFLVLPPIFFGVAAYSPERSPEVTQLMHEFGLLTLVTTDQYYIFQMVAIGVVSLSTNGENTAFPRWLGYFTLWAALVFEVGAIAFLPKDGAFSWNGLIVFWTPIVVFGTWILVMCCWMIKVIRAQAQSETPAERTNPEFAYS
jgi:hypothetical protein